MGVLGWVIIAVVVVGVVIAVFGWDRYRSSQKNAGDAGGSQPTAEVFVDPETGKRTRVWYDPTTGKRDYRDDD
jgi:hypothetical protein